MSERIFSRIEKFFKEKLNHGMPSNSSFASNQRELDRNWSKFQLRLEEAAPQAETVKKDYFKFLLPIIFFAFLGSLYFLHLYSQQLETMKKTMKDFSSGYMKMNTDTVIKTIVVYQYDTVRLSGGAGRRLLNRSTQTHSFIEKNDGIQPINSYKSPKNRLLAGQAALSADGGGEALSGVENASVIKAAANSAISRQTPDPVLPKPVNGHSLINPLKTSAVQSEQTLSSLTNLPEKDSGLSDDRLLAGERHSRLYVAEPALLRRLLPGAIVATDSQNYLKAAPMPTIVKKSDAFWTPTFRIGLVSSFEVVQNYIVRDQGCYGAGVSAELWLGRRLGFGASVGNIGNNFIRNENSLDEYGLKWQSPSGYKTSQLYGSWRYINYSVYTRYLLTPSHRLSPFLSVGTNWESDLPAIAHYTIYDIATKIQSPYPEQSLYHNPLTRIYLNLQAGLEYIFNKRLHGSTDIGYGKRVDSGTDQSASHIGLSAALWYNL